jgi:G3E family GTPase
VQELRNRGLKVGIITNDQGTELVDTQVMRGLGVPTKEIVGGCFCCKFDELTGQAEQILDQEKPDIILAEAVGSCTDLSATVYQPLRRYYRNKFNLAPLSILVEPSRIRTLLGNVQSGFPDTIRYLFEKQLAEADLIVLNKIDIINEEERKELTSLIISLVGDIPVHAISALTNQGVAGWIDALLSGRVAGDRILEINYEAYAQAEAALGWLNATVDVTSSHEFAPKELTEAFVEYIQRRSLEADMAIAHLKVFVATDRGNDRLALTENHGQPQWSNNVDLLAVHDLSLVINARIRTSPDELAKLIQDALAASANTSRVKAKVRSLESFSPLPPVPRYRLAEKSF